MEKSIRNHATLEDLEAIEQMIIECKIGLSSVEEHKE
jgi:hypothetical protein